MYNYVIGKIAETTPASIVVENNGIGYEMGVSGNTLNDAGAIGSTIKIYTYLYVREDTFALYGFSKPEEKRLFLKLIEISGVGPKLAMQILSGYDLKTLTIAIATGDAKTLCKIKGLGKKTAELIILNLKEQTAGEIADGNDGCIGVLDGDTSDAVFALVSLGVSRTDAVKIVNEVSGSVSGVENIIAAALARLN